LIVEHRKDLSRIDAVSFADANLENAAARLGRDGRIITFDPSAEHNGPIRGVSATKDAQ